MTIDPTDNKRLKQDGELESAIAVAIDGWRVTGAELEEELKELGHLALTAGAKLEKVVVQERSKPDPGTLIGSGKVDELLAMADDYDLIIFNDVLKPAQHNKLRKTFKNQDVDKGVRVIDRSDLILDIFAQRAETKDAKMQVELAQLQHNLPRKRGWGEALTRLGGGIGTRGPGETKMQIKERDIRQRIDQLQEKVDEIRSQRQTQRKRRDGIPEVSLVGYTNAGKSTLLNALSNAEAKKEDKLFATLDTKTRRVHLEADRFFLMTDTVGFINRMPDKLMEAFKATLEEIGRSDALLHVIDISSARVDDKLTTVADTLEELGMEDQHTFRVFNKVDLVDDHIVDRYRERFPDAYFVSAEEGEGLTELKQDIYRYFLDENLVERPDYAENLPLEGSISA
jgi:GTP-binding protein HflX